MTLERCLTVSLIIAAALVFSAEKPENNPLNAVVKLEVTSSKPNFIQPWQNTLQDQNSGSGVVITGNRILTNAHNVADATLISVRKHNNDILYNATVEFVDHECDLALLKVDDPKFFADITPFEIGETPPPQTQVLAVGFPMGGDGLSMTQGIISRIEVISYVHSFKNLLAAQLDAAVNPGNSGGPIFYQGKVVGIAFQGNKKGEGLGYMIPCEIIRHFLEDIKDGKVDGFGIMGFTVASLDNPDTRRSLKMKPDQTGVYIHEVNEGTPENTVQRGDVLLAIDGKTVANNGNIRTENGEPRQLSTVTSSKQIGEKVKLTLLRKGKIVSQEMTVRKSHFEIQDWLYDKSPEYYIIGGLIFTPLSYSLLGEWGKEPFPSQLKVKIGKETKSPDHETVLLALILSDPVNMGYTGFLAVELKTVNGKTICNLRDLIKTVEECKDEFITFTLADSNDIILDLNKIRAATPSILKRYRIPADRYLRK